MKQRATIVMGLALVLIASSLAWGAQWEITSDENLTLTQQSYSNNWAGKEVGSISWTLVSNSTAGSQLSDKVHSKSTLKIEYGQTHAQDAETEIDMILTAPVEPEDEIVVYDVIICIVPC